jgi:hypothetical protein
MATMAELAQQVDRLTADHLSIVVRSLAASPPSVTADHDFITYGLATEALRFFFGNQWTNENVFSIHKETSAHHRQGRLFLRTDSTKQDDQFRHMQRVTSLAEITFNLQGVDGLKQRISLMDKHDLESALGEMECAALLSHPELTFRFVTPTGSKGLDYEAEVMTSANRIVCCEIKAKSEQTSADAQTLWSTLEKARKQLPKSQPGLVLVRIPEKWVKQQDIQILVNDAIGKVFRQSHRVVAVVLTWEEWNQTFDGWNLVVSRFKDYRNNKSRLYQSDIDDLLAVIGRASNPSWLSFHAFVEQTRRTS